MLRAVLPIALAILACTARVRADTKEMAAPPAEPRTAALSWVRLPGAESCPSTQAVAQAAETLLGHAVFVSASSADVVLEGRVEPRSEGGFRATLAVTDATGALGERVVEAEGACDALLAPLSIVLAILVDPDAEVRAAPPPVPPPAPPPAEVRVETRVETRIETVRVYVPPPRWRMDVELDGALALGVTPFVTAAGEARFFLTPPGFVPFGVHGVLAPWSRAELGGGGSIDQLAFWAGVAICPVSFRAAEGSFEACAGVDVGGAFVVGESSGAAPRERERFTVGLDVSARGGVRLFGPLSLVLSAALVVPFRTEGWQRGTPPSTYYVPEPVGLVVTLGPSVELWL